MTRVTNSAISSRENFNAKNKRILSTVFSTVLFFGCAIFVASRGYICFEKFLGKPEKVDISFKFTGTQKFPSVSICTKQFFNEDVFDECQLSVANYTSKENPVWVNLIFSWYYLNRNLYGSHKGLRNLNFVGRNRKWKLYRAKKIVWKCLVKSGHSWYWMVQCFNIYKSKLQLW